MDATAISKEALRRLEDTVNTVPVCQSEDGRNIFKSSKRNNSVTELHFLADKFIMNTYNYVVIQGNPFALTYIKVSSDLASSVGPG
ncbi:hypothetical protein ACF0H5_010833 [Mactra antiquata]